MHLTLHLTSRCNLRCRYCYAEPGTPVGGDGDMTVATMRRAVALAMRETSSPTHARRSEAQSIGIVFFGGEPLLCRSLVGETVRHCRELTARTGQRFHFKMTTNGLLLDDAFFTDVDTSGVFVALSHDGVVEAHDAHRVDVRGAGTHQRTERQVDLLLHHRPHAPVMMVVTPDTVGCFAASVEWLFARGFRYLLPTIDYGAAWSKRALGRLEREYVRIADWYYRASREGHKFFFGPFELKIASHVSPDGCRRDGCGLGTQQISVAPDGRIYPCVQFVGARGGDDYLLGSVREGIDEGARRRLARFDEREHASCAECAVRWRCNHRCACVNWRSTGSVERVSPLLCAHERMLLPIADDLAARLYQRRDALFLHKHYNELYPLVSAVEDGLGPSLRPSSPRRSQRDG